MLAVAFLAAFGALQRAARAREAKLDQVKHDRVFGPFLAGFLVWLIGPLERLLVGRVSPNMITVISLLAVRDRAPRSAMARSAPPRGSTVLRHPRHPRRPARAPRQQADAAGALFDSVSDRWGELFVFAGYTWYLHDSLWLLAVLGAFGGSMMVSYTRARAEGLGVALVGGHHAARGAHRARRGRHARGRLQSMRATAEWILGVTMSLTGMLSIGTALSRWHTAYRC